MNLRGLIWPRSFIDHPVVGALIVLAVGLALCFGCFYGFIGITSLIQGCGASHPCAMP
jgi:hypothetical protein